LSVYDGCAWEKCGSRVVLLGPYFHEIQMGLVGGFNSLVAHLGPTNL